MPDTEASSAPTSPEAARRAGPRRLLTVGAAMAVLIGAGLAIFAQVRDLLPSSSPRVDYYPTTRGETSVASVAGTQAAPGHQSRLAIGKLGDHAVVSIGKNRFAPGPTEDKQHLLIESELFRQAILMAARDGLGASVRDEMLGEEPGPVAVGPGLEVHYRVGKWRQAHFSIREPGEGGKILWGRDFAASNPQPPLMSTLVATVEALARGPLVEALGQLGISSTKRTAPASAAIPPEVEANLGRMSFVAQFAAVRALHAAIRDAGESPDRLAALARGYANLGVLTRHHWNAGHRAFDARSLLYAERLNALYPKTPGSLWARAYARGLVGLHREALEDLDLARHQVEAFPEAKRPTPPAWVDLLDRRCRFDTPGLLAACEDPQRAPLAAMFAMMTVENSNAFAQAVSVARASQQASPENLWIVDASSRIEKLSHLHELTLQGLTSYGAVVPRELRQVSGLPEPAAKALAGPMSFESEVATVRALAEAGAPAVDREEPSWSALAKMVREARFAPIARRVGFMAMMWGVPVDDVLEQFRPVAADHLFWPLLEFYASDLHPRDRARVVQAMRSIPLDGVEITEMLFYQTLMRVDGERMKAAWGEASRHLDLIEPDYAPIVHQRPDGDRPNAARALNHISPYSPIGGAGLVRANVGSLDDQWNADPLARHAQHPEFLAALGARLASEKKTDEAMKWLDAAIKLSPDRETYRILAAVYKDAGRIEDWQATLDKFLAEDDPGLDHAQVQVELANHFMGRKEWDKARPYADAAAETWANWAMACALRCHEGRKDWIQAELWARRTSERYDNSRSTWFEFCARTGHGDITAAGDMMAQSVLSDPDGASINDLDRLGMYFTLLKEYRRARDTYETLARRSDNTPIDRAIRAMAWLHAALLADRSNDAEGRNKALEEAASLLDGQAPLFTKITRALGEGVRADGGKPLELGTIDQAIEDMGTDESGLQARGNISYIIGRLAENHGRKEEALKYFGYAIADTTAPCRDRALAIAALRERGLKVGPDGEL